MAKHDAFDNLDLAHFLADEEDAYCDFFDGLSLPYNERGCADAMFVDAIFYGLLDRWQEVAR
jgi:hypothetical protein